MDQQVERLSMRMPVSVPLLTVYALCGATQMALPVDRRTYATSSLRVFWTVRFGPDGLDGRFWYPLVTSWNWPILVPFLKMQTYGYEQVSAAARTADEVEAEAAVWAATDRPPAMARVMATAPKVCALLTSDPFLTGTFRGWRRPGESAGGPL